MRNIRNQKSLPQKEALTLRVIADENYPAEFAPVVMKMANLTAIETVAEKDPAAAAFIVKTTQYFVPMAGKIDAEAERKKLADDLAYYEGFLASVMKKLSNERFVASRPRRWWPTSAPSRPTPKPRSRRSANSWRRSNPANKH